MPLGLFRVDIFNSLLLSAHRITHQQIRSTWKNPVRPSLLSSAVQLPSFLHTLLHSLLIPLDFARGFVIKTPQIKKIAFVCTKVANELVTSNLPP